MKREMEADVVLYLALYKLYAKQVFDIDPTIEKKITVLLDKYLSYFNTTDKSLTPQQSIALKEPSEKKLFDKFEEFNHQLKKQLKFFKNYMCMYEILLYSRHFRD